MLPMFKEIAVQLFKKPATNNFPAKRVPKTVTGFLEDVNAGRAEIVAPVEAPEGLRGKLVYDRNVCNGCGLCIRVCPAHAIERIVYPSEVEGEPSKKRIRIYVCNCIFCGQCIDICAKKALSQSNEYLLSTQDRYADTQVVE